MCVYTDCHPPKNLSMLSGQRDCNPSSIAFATALLFGEEPGTFFDQQKMKIKVVGGADIQLHV